MSAAETARSITLSPELVLSDLEAALENISETFAPQNFEDLKVLIASINEIPDEE